MCRGAVVADDYNGAVDGAGILIGGVSTTGHNTL